MMMSADMVNGSIGSASIPMAASNPKDLAKKKRVNKSAKLKQCKLEARREQWLSKVRNKGTKEETRGGHEGFNPPAMNMQKESDQPLEKFDLKRTVEGEERSIHHYYEMDSPSGSPTSLSSCMLGSNVSGTNFTSSSGSSRSSSSGSCAGSINGEDEEQDDDCLDDWEAVADALAATDVKQELQSSSAPLLTQEPIVKPEEKPEIVETVQQAPTNNGRAWKPDDTYRPQSLPSLSKQLSLPLNSFRKHNRHVHSAPSPCPICCEDLDFTDSSFLPCSCGFRLCLFCHKRILEEDGRCPGCRKKYNHECCVEGENSKEGGSSKNRLARTRSMFTRRC
ncbi:uncharacterized protein LOC124914819 [Impatiens glandulifera]|uniref:uncharacterized protein LOC124914819 n=1 Tax=Impatiens glandulifera TaxID=253017 RepID=UPI001FB18236|nr:uncharacterized protein LOC124914819 [Impatiens glandulifera]